MKTHMPSNAWTRLTAEAAVRIPSLARHEDMRTQDDGLLRAYYQEWGRAHGPPRARSEAAPLELTGRERLVSVSNS